MYFMFGFFPWVSGDIKVWRKMKKIIKYSHTHRTYSLWIYAIELKDSKISSCCCNEIRIWKENYKVIETLTGHTHNLISIIQLIIILFLMVNWEYGLNQHINTFELLSILNVIGIIDY